MKPNSRLNHTTTMLAKAIVATGALGMVAATAVAEEPVGTTFTYQGQLNHDGDPTSGDVDLLFRLYDGPTGFNQIGSTLFFEDFAVSGGVFTVDLDFGEGVFTGEPRWLEINIDGTTLNPRQPIKPAPYAIYAAGGNEGAEGPEGPAGPQGPQGEPGDSHWSINVNNTYYTDGNVGIGLIVPNAPLQVNGGVITGSPSNMASGFSFVGGGTSNDPNIAEGRSFVGAGRGNQATGLNSFIGAGQDNTVSATSSVIGGGLNNQVNAIYSVISGGRNNIATEWYATVPGGVGNEAHGRYSFAAGRNAKANHTASFVWADSANEDFESTAIRQFLIRAVNGVGINTNSPGGFDLAVNGSAAKPGGGSWSNFSDARLKRDIQPIGEMLDRLLSLNGYTFEYEDQVIEHRLALPGTQIGLIAQEVAEVFPDWVDEDQDGYLFVTERGVTAILVEALRDLRAEKDAEIDAIRQENESLHAQNHSLEMRLTALEGVVDELLNDGNGATR